MCLSLSVDGSSSISTKPAKGDVRPRIRRRTTSGDEQSTSGDEQSVDSQMGQESVVTGEC